MCDPAYKNPTKVFFGDLLFSKTILPTVKNILWTYNIDIC